MKRPAAKGEKAALEEKREDERKAGAEEKPKGRGKAKAKSKAKAKASPKKRLLHLGLQRLVMFPRSFPQRRGLEEHASLMVFWNHVSLMLLQMQLPNVVPEWTWNLPD